MSEDKSTITFRKGDYLMYMHPPVIFKVLRGGKTVIDMICIYGEKKYSNLVGERFFEDCPSNFKKYVKVPKLRAILMYESPDKLKRRRDEENKKI